MADLTISARDVLAIPFYGAGDALRRELKGKGVSARYYALAANWAFSRGGFSANICPRLMVKA